MDVSEWLRGLGLDQYAPAFRENRITPDLLPSLTAEDLKELGVGLVGDRRRLLARLRLWLRLHSRTGSAAPEVRCQAGSRAATGDSTVLRPGRLDRAFGAARPGGSAQRDRRLPPLLCRRDRERRRVRREIHGRRRARLFRLSARRRARRRASRAGRVAAHRGGWPTGDGGQPAAAGPGWDRDRVGGGRRSHRRGCGTGAGGGRRDAQSRRPAASARRSRTLW